MPDTKVKCPFCRKSGRVETVEEVRPFRVRGEEFKLPVSFQRCGACGEEFEPLGGIGQDPLEAAYRAYRKRRGLLQPEEISGLRKSTGLTQKELAGLLGWGAVTLSRYETGALQDDAHDVALRLALESAGGLEFLLRIRGGSIREPRRRVLMGVASIRARWREVDEAMRGQSERWRTEPILGSAGGVCKLVTLEPMEVNCEPAA